MSTISATDIDASDRAAVRLGTRAARPFVVLPGLGLLALTLADLVMLLVAAF